MTRLSRPTRLAAGTLLAAALVSGCTGKNADSPGSPPNQATPSAAAPVYVQAGCSFTLLNTLLPTDPTQRSAPGPDNPGGGHGGAIPAEFSPVRVIGCGMGVESSPGEGTWQLATQTTADGDLDDLVAAYRGPAPAPAGSVCRAYADHDPVIAFVDAKGVAVWPAPPRDGVCGHISTRVTTAMNALRWRVTKSQRTSHAAAQGGSAYLTVIHPA
jgi:hypothetical protein